MPDISQMTSARFLSKGDCVDGPLLLTMLNASQVNVAKEGADEELKWCLHFSNHDKPMVLNRVNMELIAQAVGSNKTEDWTGQQIVVYYDQTISFGGKITGGLRCRAPKKKPAPVPAKAAPAPKPKADDVSAEPEDDGVPF